MASNILSVGQSALAAAQAGLATTGHNIANANTPGYSRQLAIQTTAGAQDFGFGFIGKGTEVSTVQRVFNEFLNAQVLTAQTSSNQLDTYYAQISRINNLLADSTAGLSPALQDFFKGVQDMAANPSSAAARQSALSSAEGLAARFKSIDGQLNEMRQGINAQITSSIGTVNSLALQISKLNDSIEIAQGGSGASPANDLLDQRDQLVSDLSKEIKVTVVKQNNSYNVFIGNGQPLVVGKQTFTLAPMPSPTDLGRVEVGFVANGITTMLPENGLPGGRLGGLFEARAKTLDVAQNSLGQLATGLALTFNTQHQLGQDQNGALGGNFFSAAAPVVNINNANTSTATVTASISDPSTLTASDYRLQITTGSAPGPAAYQITRLSDGIITGPFTTLPKTVDGVDFNVSTVGTKVAGDDFLIRPTANGAAGFAVAISDVTKIAAAAPLRTAASSTNTGSGKVGPAVVASTAVMPAVSLTFAAGNLTGFPSQLPVTVTTGGVSTTYAAGAPVPYTGAVGDTISFGGVQISGIPAVAGSYTVAPPTSTLTYNSPANTLTGFPTYLDVTVTPSGGGAATTYAAGTAVPYADGDTLSFGGVSFTVTGTPANGDTFTVANNTGGVGDNRNALLLAALQTVNTLNKNSASGKNTATYQSAYGQLVNLVGNKAHELEVTSKAETTRLAQAVQSQQSESGVNLDEEATNLIRYQQAYQAAGKVMQTASQLFDVLLGLGN